MGGHAFRGLTVNIVYLQIIYVKDVSDMIISFMVLEREIKESVNHNNGTMSYSGAI